MKQIFLYSTVSTLNPANTKLNLFVYEDRSRSSPIVGIVVTISPSFNLYKIVVFPAASSPTRNVAKSDLMRTAIASQLTHQYPHLLLPEEPPEEAGDGEAHDDEPVSHRGGSETVFLYDTVQIVQLDDTITV